MRKFIPTVAMATMLSLTTLGDAAPRKPPPESTHLTVPEELCLRLGGMAHSSGSLRDNGYSYLESLQRLRTIVARETTQGPLMAWFVASATSNLRATATMAIRRTRPLDAPTRSWNHCDTAVPG